MVELGVQTMFIVDSAARSYMGDVDLVVVGADAITSEGNVVNKIGTSSIAVLATKPENPSIVVSELLKFDPETLNGHMNALSRETQAKSGVKHPSNYLYATQLLTLHQAATFMG